MLAITDQDLQSIGINSLAQRRTLLSEIAKLRGSDSLPTQTIMPPPPAEPVDPHGVADVQKKEGWRRFFRGNFLVISIAVHLLFAAGAAIWVVQEIQTKRKLTFRAGEKSPNRGTRALEHRVQLQKKRQTMSAPAQSKRIVSTGLAKFTLPEMPSMPTTAGANVSKMSGAGAAPGALGATAPMAAGGTGGGGPAINFFGLRTQAKRIAFLVDYSGSMTGEFRTDVEKELERSLRALPAGSQIMIIPWAGPAWLYNQTIKDVQANWEMPDKKWDNYAVKAGARLDRPQWVTINPAAIEDLMKGVKAQELAPGGTDWRQPFRYAMQASPAPEVIFFMTDGQIPPESEARALGEIDAALKRSSALPQVNCLYIKNDNYKPDVLKKLAETYKGQFRAVGN